MLRRAIATLSLGVLLGLAVHALLPERSKTELAGPPFTPKQAAAWAHSDELTAQALGLTAADVRLIRVSRATTNHALLQMTPRRVSRELYRSHTPKSEAAPAGILWRNLSLLDENGQLADDAFSTACEQCEEIMGDGMMPGGGPGGLGVGGAAPGFGGLDSASWEEMGPGNFGGRIRTIALHPTVANRMWIGSVSGGIWRSDDGGASWSPVDDFMANLAVTSIIFDPTNANTMYAATGEGFLGTGFSTTQNALQLGRGAGIFKSTDGGVTWNQLATTDNSSFFWVNRLSFAPDGSAILAATLDGIWRSTDDGATWTQVSTRDCGDIDFDPADATRAVAGALGSANFLWSDDGGVTWNTTAIPAAATPSARRVETTWATGVADVVYASVYSDTNNASGSRSVLYRSTDNGETFTIQNQTTNFLAQQGWYDNIVWVAPTDTAGNPDDQTVIVGGVWLFRSTDGGATFTQISNGNDPSPHADNHYIVGQVGFDGSAPATSNVYFGTDGGIYRANDVHDAGTNAGRGDTTQNFTSGWVNLNNDLGITQFYGGDAVAANDGTMLGGTQDNGTLLGTGAGGINGWTQVRGADGSYASIDRNNNQNMYGAIQVLGVFRSTDGGANSASIHGQLNVPKPPPFIIPDTGNNANFIAASYLDPNNSNRLLAGGASLWRTDDVLTPNTAVDGPSWANIKPSIGSNISTLTIAPGNSDIVWVGHNDGRLFYTTDGTAANPTWIRRDNQTPNLPNRFVTRIIIDPANNSRVFVCFGGFFDDNVWETTDDGANWRQLTGMPAMPYRDLQIHPNNPTWLYAASELGVLTSENNGFSWAMTNDGPANVPVDDLMWVDTTLYAATHGRGWFRQETTDPADVTAPVITCSVARPLMWPARRGLMPIGLTASATDDTDPAPEVSVNIYSNEPEGAPPFAPDMQGSSPATTKLRAERNFPGGTGRVYLIVVSAKDEASNVSHVCKTVTVPVFPVGFWVMQARMQAMTAEAFCAANDGQPPAGYTLIGTYVVP
ncbi:MAG: hypothetical protein QNJ90_02505 [Planctomycetota bacterium]|nr:hypothetical protein [Planctomycetota bacterium]